MSELSSIHSSQELMDSLNRYNWDDGFDFPLRICEHPNCELSIALTAFYLADGLRYLQSKDIGGNHAWSAFILYVYHRIKDGYYKQGTLSFEVPLSRTQIYQLDKLLSEEEKIFIQSFN